MTTPERREEDVSLPPVPLPSSSSSPLSTCETTQAEEKESPGDMSESTPTPTPRSPGDLSESTPIPAPAPSIASPERNGSDAAMDTQDSDPIAEVVDASSPPESEAKEGEADESADTPMEEEEEEVVDSLLETEGPVSSMASSSIPLEGLPADTPPPPLPPPPPQQQENEEKESEEEEAKKSSPVDNEIPTEDASSSVTLTQEKESEVEEAKKSSPVDNENPTEDTSSVMLTQEKEAEVEEAKKSSSVDNESPTEDASSSVALTQEVSSPPSEEDSGIIKISSVASLTDMLSNDDEDDDIVEMPQSDIGRDGGKDKEGTLGTDKELPSQSGTEERGDINGSSLSSSPRSNISTSSAAPKKMGLKLASFAGLGQNGIADTTPVSGHGNISGCKQCQKEIDKTVDQLLMWETMQFCCETCLRNYQTDFNQCSSCSRAVNSTSVGKYCVRFGSDIKQFCSNVCLETYKKGLKVCCYCQKDISGGEGFLAPIGDKGQFKDFCLQSCLKRYEALHLGKPLEKEVLPCAVCSDLKPVEVQLLLKGSSVVKLCGNPCFSAFKFAKSLDTSYCDFCANPYDIHASDHVVYYENHVKRFCSMSCQNVYVMKFRKIVPCQWCKVKKYNFDMVEKPSPKGVVFHAVYCSVNCLNLHGFTRKGDVTHVPSPPRNPPSWNPPKPTATSSSSSTMPVIQSVSSLAPENPPPPPPPSSLPFTAAPEQPPPPILDPATPGFKKGIIREYIVKCPDEVQVRNKATLTKPYMSTKGVSCKPLSTSKSTQTDAPPPSCLLPLTVPFYLPVPLRMYASPYPVPVPIPLPIPVPVFLPINRSSLEGVKKSVQKIHAKLPSDPFEAELLAMAGAIADKASSLLKDSDSEEEEDEEDEETDKLAAAAATSLENNGDNNKDEESIGDSTAAASSTSKDDPVEDLEKEILADKVVPKAPPPSSSSNNAPSTNPSLNLPSHNNNNNSSNSTAGRTRSGLKRRTSCAEPEESSPTKEMNRPKTRGRPSKSKQSRIEPPSPSNTSSSETTPPSSLASSRNMTPVPKERPDSKHHLKFTYGVNAWRHWVIKKNAEFERGQAEGKYVKSFETDLLKLRADELNYTLCLFVKEVKKPNGDSYAPDSVFYLTLGIQEYLFENGRIDNIFTDSYYEPFTSTLHEVVRDFKLPVNELGYFVTRIEEEHLWESKQLGCHTPQVLLNTLIYLNTKYFMLKTCDEHAKLSFNQITKHWKKTMTPGKNDQEKRTVLLRYHPPRGESFNKSGKVEDRKWYEQHEKPDNPARCPVKYYEQYIAKCSESTKRRSDVFYLQPERSCVADSPVWFSNEQLSTHQLEKMLQRLLMVREIQEHMLADASTQS